MMRSTSDFDNLKQLVFFISLLVIIARLFYDALNIPRNRCGLGWQQILFGGFPSEPIHPLFCSLRNTQRRNLNLVRLIQIILD